MNLLPPDIIRRRQISSRYRKIAAKTAAIFLSAILSVVIFEFILIYREARILILYDYLDDPLYEESKTAGATAREILAWESEQSAVMDMLELYTFDANRLDMIHKTLPADTQLLMIDIDENGAVLTVNTDNIGKADTHIDSWMATGLAARASIISVTVSEVDNIQYILDIRWAYE